jgi:hypothetical protein
MYIILLQENSMLTSDDDFGNWTPSGDRTHDYFVNWANFPSVTSLGMWKFDLNLTDLEKHILEESFPFFSKL